MVVSRTHLFHAVQPQTAVLLYLARKLALGASDDKVARLNFFAHQFAMIQQLVTYPPAEK